MPLRVLILSVGLAALVGCSSPAAPRAAVPAARPTAPSPTQSAGAAVPVERNAKGRADAPVVVTEWVDFL